MNLKRLKRFSQQQHDQLEQLLAWCQLMGLTGKDLVSLGGHIDRMQAAERKEKCKNIVNSFNIKPVGKDRAIEHRFSIKTIHGQFRFSSDGFDWVEVFSYVTKDKRRYALPYYTDIGQMHWRKRWIHRALLAVHDGTIKLDF